GLVVDDAVMVMENIYRHAEMGKDKVTAASEGTKEITFAALAATIAVIAIFLPVAFMNGVIGKYFMQFGVTLSVAVLISYIEAITLAPARCAQMLNVSHKKGFVARVGDKLFEKLSAFYSRTLARALRWPKIVVLFGVLVMGVAWISFKQLKQEMVPSQDQSRLQVRLRTTTGSDLAETDRLTQKAEAVLLKHPELVRVQTTISIGSATLSLTLVEPGQRKMTQAQFSNTIRRELQQIPGVSATVQDLSQQGFAGGRGKPVEISVRGSDWTALIALAAKTQKELADAGLAGDLDSDYDLGPPELSIAPDRPAAADVGVNVTDIATTVSTLVGGTTVGQYSTAGRRMNIEMRLLAGQRTRPEDLERLRVRATGTGSTSTTAGVSSNPAGGLLVPLSSVVIAKEIAQLQTINHANRQRAIRITGNVGVGHSQSEVLDFARELSGKVPVGYSLVLSGQSSQFGDSMKSLGFALIVGIIFAYMVLASQFNSLMHPLTVLTILPLSLAGAMLALLITGKTLNVFSMIGLLLLMGIVKKNSIILVDYANEVRHKENLDATEAMRRAGPVRLRPILMTAIATLMAAVPSALGLGPGAETRGPMADAIIGGLILSTVLSLFVVPAFYVLADRYFGARRTPPAAIAAV
ncbi:MAG: efflux RND transporter permease subunit, partial [Kofleriaceae bacterium]